MPHADFVHLRVHSAYSLSEGAIELCRRQLMPAVAVTDTGNLFGALEFALAARDAGIQPIIGCQLAITRDDTPAGEGAVPRNGQRRPPDQLVLLVQDEIGYGNLLRLASRAFMDSDSTVEPQLPLAALQGHTDGLIALTGGPAGQVGRLLAEGQDELAVDALTRLADLFPG